MAGERSLPFFHTLKDCAKKSDFKWTDEAEEAFQEMKALLKNLPTLTAPIAGKTLILYLVVSKEAVSFVLVAERGDVQMPIYFVSKVLSGSELNYLPIEKLPEISGRLTKWAIKLGEHEIAYCARNAIKGQVMADYLGETAADIPTICGLEQLPAPFPELCELYSKGAASSEGAGAEYEALIAGMRIAQDIGVKKLQAYVDSQFKQINGTFDANDKSMQSYLARIHSLADALTDFKISQIPRSQNKQADVLSKLAAHLVNNDTHNDPSQNKQASRQGSYPASSVPEEGPSPNINPASSQQHYHAERMARLRAQMTYT
ncbi:uncharacterized protein [Rutidosis leptorrhynchoides]|uniref:uncharacterized protein n=1 Tax=Rutidosis leptorrhynchoides TaxID=125765 RepID=UPI003A99BE49